MATGVTGIALSGTILRADNPIEETRRIINIEKINNK
jgi:thiamine-phosphate pyrophosphorylase